MKILIVFPAALYPVTGMSQVRAINQLKRLAQDHEITLADFVSRPGQETECRLQLSNWLKDYKPVYSTSYRKLKLFRALRYLVLKLIHLISSYSMEELTLTHPKVKRQMSAIIGASDFDGVLIHYWYLGYVFDLLKENSFKMIDTHYLVEENLSLLIKYRQNKYLRHRMLNEFRHSLKYQHQYFSQTDMIIVNSARQAELLDKSHPEYKVSLTVNGQSLDELVNYKTEVEQSSILFYGALSNQFNRLALERVLEKIFPAMLEDNPTLHLYVVGSNPPGDIISKYNNPFITVTGFVQDIKPVIGKCCLLLLPMETGSGFRGRAVEVMALGVPIVGTSNALQSIGITEGKQGFLAETDDELIEKASLILRDKDLHDKMSKACRRYTLEHFSIEGTFGMLSKEISIAVKEKADD